MVAQSQPTENPRFIFTLPGVLCMVGLYALVHTWLRLGSSFNLGDDDVLDNLLVQTLAPGYGLTEGPLYDWALWLVQQVLGPTLPSFLLLKYGMLMGVAAGLFGITRRITGSAMWGFVAVESMAMVYQIFWRLNETFTTLVATMVLTVWTLWAVLRVLDRGRARDHLSLALCVGLGLLTTHEYTVFLLALALACWWQPAVRQRLWRAPVTWVWLVPVLLVWPYAHWVLAQVSVGSVLAAATGPGTMRLTWQGARDAVLFPVLVLSPYALAVPAVFPGLRKVWWRATHRPATASEPDAMRLLTHLLLLQWAILLLKDGWLWPRFDYPVQSLLPLFVLVLPWVTAKLQALAPTQRRVQGFLVLMGCFTLFALGMRTGNLYMHEPFCQRCRWGVPYEALAKHLQDQGFQGGTVVVADKYLGGNLRRFFPHSRFALVDHHFPLPQVPSEPTLLIWTAEESADGIPASLQPWVPANAPPPQDLRSPWAHAWRPSGYRHSAWRYVLLDAPMASVAQ